MEDGLAVLYRYHDLESQGLLSSDVSRPFKRVLPRILEVARRFKQIYVTIYYPHTFGHAPPSASATSSPTPQGNLPAITSKYSNSRPEHKYTNILREVVPTRTGLDAIKSSAVMWLSKVNDAEPHLSDAHYLASIVYKKENGVDVPASSW